MKRQVITIFLISMVLTACGKKLDNKTVAGTEASVTDGSEIIETSISQDGLSDTEESILSENASVSFDSADYAFEWEEFKEIMSEEDYKELCRYYPMLKDNQDICIEPGDSYSKITNLEELTKDDQSDGRYYAFELWSIALVDMDNKHGKDLIIEISGYNYDIDGQDEYFLPPLKYVISEIDGKYYGCFVGSERSFLDLQNNGLFHGSGSAACTYYRKVDMEPSCCKEYEIARTDVGERSDGSRYLYFYINDENGEEKERWEYDPDEPYTELMEWHNENFNDTATWYNLPACERQGKIEVVHPEPFLYNLDEH